LLTQLESLETQIGRAWSLLRRFPHQYAMVNRLLVEKETIVLSRDTSTNSEEREAVAGLFYTSDSANRKLVKQEYVLQTANYPYVTPGHRLYVTMDGCMRACETTVRECAHC
ncbi:hypothetical protein H4R35_007254, partial [Dimargaris xerosporica]